MNIISLQDVTIAFRKHVVLKNINLDIRKGETLVLMGPSGHGKTSLLKTLSGLISPEYGKVFIEQSDWLTLGNKQRLPILKKMGILFQKNALFDSFSCLENIAFPLRETTTLTEPEIEEKAQYFLEQVGIPQARNLYPDEISGGMQKRLGIARALALEPEIIFYDDPTAGLDPVTSKRIVELIMRLKKEKGSTVVAVMNDMNRIYQMADKVAMVVDQEVLILGSPDQLAKHQDERVQQFIQGRAEGPLSTL